MTRPLLHLLVVAMVASVAVSLMLPERHLKTSLKRKSVGRKHNAKEVTVKKGDDFSITRRQVRVDDCWQGGPAQPMNWESGAWLNIFTELAIDCPGTVMRWEFYARQPGTFMAGIWRPQGTNRFRFIGANTITVATAGVHVTHISSGARIIVEPGDLIGLHYPAAADGNTGGVVPYDDSRYPLSDGVTTSMLSPFHNSDTRDETLVPGSTVVYGLAESWMTRLPAIKAFVGIGSSGGALMMLGYDADSADELDGWTNAIYVTDPSQSASSDGVVVGWNLYVQRAASITLQVWRPTSTANRYILIGETPFEPEDTGVFHISLEGDAQIPIQEGDTLGMYFSGDSVIPYNNYYPCNDYNAHRYFKPYSWNGRVEEGDGIQFEIAEQSWGACRAYSFSAEILFQSGPSPPGPQPSPGPGPGPSPGPTSGPAPAGDCGAPYYPPSVEHRIVGGVPAIPHSWPWMVSLQTAGGFHFCGGSLINSEWVVTAAHCMPGWESSNNVVLGMHNKVSGSEQTITRHATATSHPSYDSWASSSDIALLHLDSPVDITEEVSPVCLPEQGEAFTAGTYCYTTGWGDTAYGGSSPDVLLQVGVPLVSTEQCNHADWYGGSIDETMVCAGYEEGGRDSCQGDSGGPLVCQNGDGVWRLIGVVSWGYGCASPRNPGVYSYVPQFRDWIDNETS